MEITKIDWKLIVAFIPFVIGIASIIVKITPSQTDNKILDVIIKILQALSLIKK